MKIFRENSNGSPNVRPMSPFIPVAIFLEIESGDILKQTSADLLTGDTSAFGYPRIIVNPSQQDI